MEQQRGVRDAKSPIGNFLERSNTMAFCANCGATLTDGGGFCGSCGRPAGVATQATALEPQIVATNSPAGSAGLTSNVAAALAYILGLITGIAFLVLEPYKRDRFVRFHAMQSILFCGAAIVFSIAMSIVWRILFSISTSLIFVVMPLRLVIALGLFLFWLFVMYQAYSQREYRIPIIGAIAAKQVE
jgi:uncharacterized membrane protein